MAYILKHNPVSSNPQFASILLLSVIGVKLRHSAIGL